MPEIPAPATSTSKCSLVIGRNSSPRTLHTPTRWADHPPAVGEAESTGQEAGTADRLAIPFLRPQRDLGGEGECGWDREGGTVSCPFGVRRPEEVPARPRGPLPRCHVLPVDKRSWWRAPDCPLCS